MRPTKKTIRLVAKPCRPTVGGQLRWRVAETGPDGFVDPRSTSYETEYRGVTLRLRPVAPGSAAFDGRDGRGMACRITFVDEDSREATSLRDEGAVTDLYRPVVRPTSDLERRLDGLLAE